MKRLMLGMVFSLVCFSLFAGEVCENGDCKRVRVTGRRNIAPDAVPTVVNVERTELSRDCCCNPVCTTTVQGVQVCVPSCSCGSEVRTSLNGKRKVYDFGRYEVVVADREDSVDVRYRKRLLDR